MGDPGTLHYIIKVEFILWSVMNVMLGAHSAFSLLNWTRAPNMLLSVKITLKLLASILLASGLWSSQIMLFRGWDISSGLVTNVLEFQPGFMVLSFVAPTWLIFIGYSVLDFNLTTRALIWCCGLCGALIGISAGVIQFSLFLTLPSFDIAFRHSLVSISFLISICVSLFSHFVHVLHRKRKYLSWIFWCLPCITGICMTASMCVMQLAITLIPSTISSDNNLSESNKKSAIDIGPLALLPSIIMTIALVCACTFLYYLDARIGYNNNSSVRLYVTSIAFCEDGGLSTNEYGVLPIRTIDLTGIPKDILQDANVRRSIYYWLLSISLDWHAILPYFPRIIQLSTSTTDKYQPLCPFSFDHFPCVNNNLEEYSTKSGVRPQFLDLLKVRLLEAVAQLSVELGTSLSDIGIPFDDALEISTHKNEPGLLRSSAREDRLYHDVEGAIDSHINTGMVLFLVRGAPKPFTTDMTSRSQGRQSRVQSNAPHISTPRFVRRFRDTLANITGETGDLRDVDNILLGCREYAIRGLCPILEADKTYVSIFAERWSPDGSTEVLVYDFAKHQIPCYRLDLSDFLPHMRRWLRDMSNSTVSDLISVCEGDVSRGRIHNGNTRKHTAAEEPVHLSMLLFKKAFAVAIKQLMRDVSFIGEDLPLWTQLSEIILDVPTCGSKDSQAHMIILHYQETRSSISVENLSEFTHSTHSYGSYTSSSNSSARCPRMPSVFTYVPREMYDRHYAIATSPVAREEYRKEAVNELEHILYAGSLSRRQRSEPVAHSGPSGRQPLALVSSFSIDSEGEDKKRPTARQRIRSGWSSLKGRARSLTSRTSRRRLGDGREHDELFQVPLSLHPLSSISSTTTYLTNSSSEVERPIPVAVSSNDRCRVRCKSSVEVNVIGDREEAALPFELSWSLRRSMVPRQTSAGGHDDGRSKSYFNKRELPKVPQVLPPTFLRL